MKLTVTGFAWPLVVFTLPIAAMATYLILRTLWSEIGSDPDQHREVYATHRAISVWVVLFVLALHVLVLLNLAGVEWLRSSGPRLAVVLFGALFVVIGNLLPRTRPNLALGIRTSRTLSDRNFWMRLHRTCGHLSVLLGAIIVISGLVVSSPAIGPVIAVAALSSLAMLLVAYRRQRDA